MLPLITPSHTPAYVAEGDLIPDNAVNWAYVTGMPLDRAGLKGWYPITKEAIRTSAVKGLDNVITQRVLIDIASKADLSFYVGHGDGVSAVQKITVTAAGGTFTVTYKGQTTSGLAFDAAASAVQTAIRGLSTVGSGNVTVTGSAGGPYTVTFAGALAHSQVDDLVVNGASLTGTGANVTVEVVKVGIEPDGITGIFNQAGTQQAEYDTSDLDSLLDAVAVAKASNVSPNRWYVNPVDFVELRKIHKGTGDVSYVLDPDPHQGTVFTLFGIPVTESNFVPQGKAALGDTQFAKVIRDTDAEVFVTEHALAQRYALAIRVALRMDLVVTQPRAWVILSES
ncbi:phage major capsid protein [Mycolicibacterium sphagni]|uniref:Phage major capsid protein n=1 Tax=Mycolicibacterium sphagni TaxID=1786 RepID=A0A255DW94_9MYCO|nr:phage major capsid protein [Mycolicibacterium sphagni]